MGSGTDGANEPSVWVQNSFGKVGVALSPHSAGALDVDGGVQKLLFESETPN